MDHTDSFHFLPWTLESETLDPMKLVKFMNFYSTPSTKRKMLSVHNHTMLRGSEKTTLTFIIKCLGSSH